MGSSRKETSSAMVNGGGASTLRTSRGMSCTWQSIWTFAITLSMLLFYLLTPSHSSSSLHCLSNPHPQLRQQQQQSPRVSELLHSKRSKQSPWSGDLRELTTAWNHLCFGSVSDARLRIALFVKKWPVGGVPGGLERHALTLHRDLARRGHQVYVYTASAPDSTTSDGDSVSESGLHVHFSRPTAGGGFDYRPAWDRFLRDNATEAFDLVHTESVALPHWKAEELGPNMAASWHGIGYEVIISELVQDLIRKPGEPRTPELQRALTERLSRVADEIRFFPSYKHHVATSDYVADVLHTIYQIPTRNVHTILNGVDENRFRPDTVSGNSFRLKFGVPVNATLVFGAAGRLVRDKGHPLLFEAFRRVSSRHPDVYLLVAGNGPWGDRYRELAPNVKTLGPMNPGQLSDFYNALDVFVNPTLRSQGLDHTLLEAMQCGKPLLATHFSSITWSVILNGEFGGTFPPNVEGLEQAMEDVIQQGKEAMRTKGKRCQSYASHMFTATKMGAAYERLFLCFKDPRLCQYPLPGDCSVSSRKYLGTEEVL